MPAARVAVAPFQRIVVEDGMVISGMTGLLQLGNAMDLYDVVSEVSFRVSCCFS